MNDILYNLQYIMLLSLCYWILDTPTRVRVLALLALSIRMREMRGKYINKDEREMRGKYINQVAGKIVLGGLGCTTATHIHLVLIISIN